MTGTATLRELYADPACSRALHLKRGAAPTAVQIERVASLIRSRYGVSIASRDLVHRIIVEANAKPAAQSADFRAERLVDVQRRRLGDGAARSAKAVTAAASTPGEVMNALEKKIISVVTRSVNDLVRMASENPDHYREIKSLLDEVQAQKKSPAWTRRAAAEAGEEALQRALHECSGQEDDEAVDGSADDYDDDDDSDGEDDKPSLKKASLVIAHGTGLSSKGRDAETALRSAYSDLEEIISGAGQQPDALIRYVRGNALRGPQIEFGSGHRLIPVQSERGGWHFELYLGKREIKASTVASDAASAALEAIGLSKTGKAGRHASALHPVVLRALAECGRLDLAGGGS